ncbi:MAG: phenylalanine--tRNA ligase subunit alpha [Bacteroidetes bacterium]|nr:phenylalanine--tRNA ligase subunit alpha [Bacteroidota bacterium]MCW5897014.1 phenylalanine--tRNA ligase subunit alpha [Bacteroidota bacterium]
MQTKIAELREQVEAEIASVTTAGQLEAFRIKFLARKGLVALLFDELKNVPTAEKPMAGKQLNELRQRTQSLFDEKAASLKSAPHVSAQLDPTLPGRRKFLGTKHPLMQTLDEIKSIFVGMGFGIADGPEIEDDWHNFGALNFPPDHPARDMQDTFFIDKNILLRTHTSPVQIRVMENTNPPIRTIMPGRVYRNEAVSARSLCNFYQVEGLAVDVGITFSELKGTLLSFARQFYGKDIKYRFRPSFFPFTEPSAEMDITCFICKGRGCRMCKHSGWLEILGCGMVDPNVFLSVGYDPQKYTGYAFGMGIERTAALLYGVDDIRLFYENDVRFLRQF